MGAMIIIELVLHFITYTVLIIALFLGILCYKRNLETKESIAFIVSLIFLVSSVSLSTITDEKASAVFIQIAMLMVSVTTFLNVLQERKHRIPSGFIKMHIAVAIVLFLGLLFFGESRWIQWSIVTFLILSVVTSMAVLRSTLPKNKYAHLEKANRFFSVIFLTLVPVYLIFHYGFGEAYTNLRIGFMLPLVFILSGAHKIYDDLHRLSIIRKHLPVQEQHFINYELTQREREIAMLLTQGLSYQNIADQLFISLPTVKTHCSHIYKKCEVKSRYELSTLVNS